MSSRRLLLLAALGGLAVLAAPGLARAARGVSGVATARFATSHLGQALLHLTASAAGTDWGAAGRESAVLTVTVDGYYKEDVVLYAGASTFGYDVALGGVGRGRHTIALAFNPAKSSAGATDVHVSALSAQVVHPGTLAYDVLRYSPVIYGRALGGAYENDHTDVPALMFHTVGTDASGATTIEYSVVFSDEDAGTSPGALMARWGRTTDIEWAYRVTLDAQGRPLSEVYQAPGHASVQFTGEKSGLHPLLEVATANNLFAEVTEASGTSGYRFFLDPSAAEAPGRAREEVMVAHPWTYVLMAEEAQREGRIEATADPQSPDVSDQRNYLYLELSKRTTYDGPAGGGSWAGVALAVKLRRGDAWYLSNHGIPDWSVQRDGAAATSVELPAGTTAADVEAIKAVAVPVNGPPRYAIAVDGIDSAFFLDRSYLPEQSFVNRSGGATLTPEQPEAVVWTAP